MSRDDIALFKTRLKKIVAWSALDQETKATLECLVREIAAFMEKHFENE